MVAIFLFFTFPVDAHTQKVKMPLKYLTYGASFCISQTHAHTHTHTHILSHTHPYLHAQSQIVDSITDKDVQVVSGVLSVLFHQNNNSSGMRCVAKY